jgi:hypothetical protein
VSNVVSHTVQSHIESKLENIDYSPPFSSQFSNIKNQNDTKIQNSQTKEKIKGHNITPMYLYEPLFSITVPFLHIENKMLYLVC